MKAERNPLLLFMETSPAGIDCGQPPTCMSSGPIDRGSVYRMIAMQLEWNKTRGASDCKQNCCLVAFIPLPPTQRKAWRRLGETGSQSFQDDMVDRLGRQDGDTIA
jgi:hypothetical protein